MKRFIPSVILILLLSGTGFGLDEPAQIEDGIYQELYPSGKLRRRLTYQHNQLNGPFQSFDEEGHPNLAGRRAAKFAEALKTQTQIPVILWDESFSTQDARSARIEIGVSRKKRSGHQDAFAAVIILQSYLEAKRNT